MVEITIEQKNNIDELFELMEREGLEKDKIKEKILETHITKGWKGTRTDSLDGLSTSDMGTVLFGEYGIKREKYRIQEYRVYFKINKFTNITNLVSVRNGFKLDDDEIIKHALTNLSQIDIQVDENMYEKTKIINKELK